MTRSRLKSTVGRTPAPSSFQKAAHVAASRITSLRVPLIPELAQRPIRRISTSPAGEVGAEAEEVAVSALAVVSGVAAGGPEGSSEGGPGRGAGSGSDTGGEFAGEGAGATAPGSSDGPDAAGATGGDEDGEGQNQDFDMVISGKWRKEFKGEGGRTGEAGVWLSS